MVRRSQFVEHKKIANKLNTDFYFAHSYASWERILNEYSNKLVRQYPKPSDFNEYIKQVQYKINRRLRKNVIFKKPQYFFYNCVAFWGNR